MFIQFFWGFFTLLSLVYLSFSLIARKQIVTNQCGFTGVVPATSFLKDSGINMTDRGFIPVNEVGTLC